MKKRKNTKKVFAIIAILLFIGPLFFNAYIYTSNYIKSKNAEAQTAETTTENNDNKTENETENTN